MGSAVDAARQSRNDDETGLAEAARQGGRKLSPGTGGVSCPDDGDGRAPEQGHITEHGQERWGIGQGGEGSRVVGLIAVDQATASARQSPDLILDLGRRRDVGRR